MALFYRCKGATKISGDGSVRVTRHGRKYRYSHLATGLFFDSVDWPLLVLSRTDIEKSLSSGGEAEPAFPRSTVPGGYWPN